MFTKDLRIFLLSWVFGCLFLSPTVSLAGVCNINCERSSRTRFAVTNQPSESEEACRSLCTAVSAQGENPGRPAACQTDEVCHARYSLTNPANTAAGICECRCVAGSGGSGDPVTVNTTSACPQIAETSQECVDICTRRCADPVAPVRANMVRDAAREPRCIATTSQPTSPAIIGATNGLTTQVRDAVPLTLSQSIGGVSEVRDIGDYIAVIYRYAIGLAGAAAAIMLVYGGFLYLMGSAAGEVGQGKTIIQDALIGLLLVLGSYAILNTVNPNTLNLTLPNIQPILSEDVPAERGFSGRPAASVIGQICRCTGAECRGRVPECEAQGSCASEVRTLPCPTGQTCAYDLVNRTDRRENAWRCMVIPVVASVQSNQDASPQVRGCTEDEDCEDADRLGTTHAKCLLDSSNFGYCTTGALGQRCRCTAGTSAGSTGQDPCSISDTSSLSASRVGRALAGDPVNNAGRGYIDCQAGLQCAMFVYTPTSERERALSGSSQRWYCQPPTAGTPALATPPATPTPTPPPQPPVRNP